MKGWDRFANYVLFVTAFTVFVILWGAFVRATGSGAGCGSHWPLCNGEVIPRTPRIETLIEFTHRLTSGLLGLFVLATVFWAHRLARPRSCLRRAAWAVGLLVLSEALIGAGIVKFEWVATNISMARVITMVFHLANTFVLLSALSLLWWVARNRWDGPVVWPRGWSWLPLGAVMILGMSGAAVALGDTLVIGEGLRPEQSPLLARLIAYRWTHPTLALVAFTSVLIALHKNRGTAPAVVSSDGWGWGRTAAVLFAAQLVLGAVNVWLKAPVPIQLVHLLVSDVIWILLYLSGLAFAVGRNGGRGENFPLGDVVGSREHLA